MIRTIVLAGAAAVGLAACEETTSNGSMQFITPLPNNIVQLAAPNQDLNAVRIDPVDGCFVYRHVGPVETTFLPLRSKGGRPICTRAPEETPPAT